MEPETKPSRATESATNKQCAVGQSITLRRSAFNHVIVALMAALVSSPIWIDTEHRGDPQLDALKKEEEDALLKRHQKLSTAIRESLNRHDAVIDDQLLRELQKYLSDVNALSKKNTSQKIIR